MKSRCCMKGKPYMDGENNQFLLTGDDIEIRYLPDLRLAVIGYGNQGRAQALNLVDSGCDVVVGLRPDSPRLGRAESDGMTVLDLDKAAETSDMVFFLIPDETHTDVFNRYIEPVLKPGRTLVFAHGFSLHYGLVKPASDVDVVLVSPKGIGSKVREMYLQGFGVPGLVAVYNDATGHARQKALEVCHALGFLRCGVLETTVAEETEVDLFTEQAVLCGGLSSLIEAAFDTLTEAGYSPEIAYFECLHEVKLIADMLYLHGVSGMRDRISSVALHGDIFVGPRIIDQRLRDRLKLVLAEIRDGTFFDSYMGEIMSGRQTTGEKIEKSRRSLLETVGRRLRQAMKKNGGNEA